MCALMKIALLFFITLGWTSITEAGSPCPARETIYPCHCTSVPLTKKITFTIINCRHVPQTSSLTRIFNTLRTMNIDRFVLYDSFWEADKLGDGSGINKKLPANWLTLLKIKEIEIIDSHLSNDFACDITASCSNIVLNELTIHNSSLEGEMTSRCKQGTKLYYWTSCLNRLRNLRIIGNKLKSFAKDMFPTAMSELLQLNLSHNEITDIGKDAFKNLPKMNSLDLSHNLITDISQGIFGGKATVLSFLDLSWNFIKQLSPDIFQHTPHLVHFGVRENQIEQLPESSWKYLSEKIKLIDLSDNPLECDCEIIWINCTLKVHTNVLGYCLNEGYENTPLRRVSIYMSERCKDGKIEERKKDEPKRNACLDRQKQQQAINNDLSPSYAVNGGLNVQVTLLTNDPSSSNSRRNRRRNQ